MSPVHPEVLNNNITVKEELEIENSEYYETEEYDSEKSE
jgi:hypothetical protein